MSCEGSSPITSRCPGSQGRQESTHPTPPCLQWACLGRASSSASMLLPRELDIHPSTWKGDSPKLNFALTEFYEVQAPACNTAPSRPDRAKPASNARVVGHHAPALCMRTQETTQAERLGEGLGYRGRVERRAGGWSSDPMIEAGAPSTGRL